MSDRNLGDLGEDTLRRWASSRNITAQEPSKDRFGWDFLLEFPKEGAWGITGGISSKGDFPALIKCLVQVKATAADPGPWSVQAKLSSCYELARTDLPAFFLLLRFGSSDVPEEGFLLPLDELLIGQIFERVQQSREAGKAMSDLSICLRPTATSAPVLGGPDLEREIRAHIGGSMEEYTVRRLAWKQRVGHEDSWGQVRFEVSGPMEGGKTIEESLVDLALGLRESLPVSKVRFERMRFGLTVGAIELEMGELAIPQEPVGQVEASFRCEGAVARLRMDVFAPVGLAAVVDPSILKLRLASSFIQLVLGRRLEASITMPDSQVSLRKLYELASFVSVMDLAKGRGSSVEMILSREGREIMRADIESPPGWARGLITAANVIQDAWKVARHLDIDNETEIELSELQAQAMALAVFAGLIDPGRRAIRLEFSLDSSVSTRKKRICAPLGSVVQLGRFSGAVVVSCWGSAKRLGRKRKDGQQKFRLETTERRTEKTVLSYGDDQLPSLAKLAHEVADTFAQDDSVICVLVYPSEETS